MASFKNKSSIALPVIIDTKDLTKRNDDLKTKVVLVAVMRAQPRPRKIQENIVYRSAILKY